MKWLLSLSEMKLKLKIFSPSLCDYPSFFVAVGVILSALIIIKKKKNAWKHAGRQTHTERINDN